MNGRTNPLPRSRFALLLVLGSLSLSACDQTIEDPAELAELELELDIELQLEQAHAGELECSEWAPADWLPESSEAQDTSISGDRLDFCVEWTPDDLSISSPEQQVPVGTCSVWQESKWVGTNVQCGEDGVKILSYMRECSQCYPGPVVCGAYYFSHTLCNCTIC